MCQNNPISSEGHPLSKHCIPLNKPCTKATAVVLATLALLVAGTIAAGLLLPNTAFGQTVVGYLTPNGAITLSASLGGLSLTTYILTLCVHYLNKINPERTHTETPATTLAGSRGQQVKGERTDLCHYSYIEKNHATEKSQAVEKISNNNLSPQEKRALGVMLGMAIGDAIGAPFEFKAFNRDKPYKTGPLQIQGTSHFHLKAGQWTDDTSMGLCLADTLIEHGKLDQVQLMWAFVDWWDHGYNNAFTKDPHGSVGLGGNISQGLRDFKAKKYLRKAKGDFKTQAGDIHTSGNGSLMRNGPVALFASTVDEAENMAWEQSVVTHQGFEAAGCCQLMAYMLFHAIHSEKTAPLERKAEVFGLLDTFQDSVNSILALARSGSAVENPKTKKKENWNWKSEDFTFNKDRLEGNPGYIGSYAMDGLAWALHCVYTTDSFEEAVSKAVRYGGDADTVGAITGQIAGAIYGYDAIPSEWIKAVEQWDRGGEIATRAFLLMKRT